MKQGTVRVESGSEADLDQVVEIERASFSDPWSRDSFVRALDEPVVHFMLARDAGRVAGYVVAWFVADQGEIANLAVGPVARRRGIGAALLDATIAEASRRGVSDLFLEVRDSNRAGRALYASRGFAEVGRRRGYYRKPVEDAVVLRRFAYNPPVESTGSE